MKRYSGLAGWFVAGVLMLIGAGQSDTTRMKKLVIDDVDGNPRMILTTMHNGQPTIILSDKDNPRLVIYLDESNAPHFQTCPQGGQPHDLIRP